MNKFTGPSKILTYEPKSQMSTSRHQSSSSYKSTKESGSTTTTTTQSSKSYAITYSALPKPNEPPVNSAEYFRLMQQGGGDSAPSTASQPAAPPHMQGPAPGFGALRDRFKTGSFSEGTNSPQDTRSQAKGNPTNSSLSSLRDQYVNRAKEAVQVQEESFSQRVQNVSRSIVGEERSQAQPVSTPQPSRPQEESHAPAQPVDEQPASRSIEEQAASSEGALADGGSSSGASSLENDPTHNAAAAVAAEVDAGDAPVPLST